MPAIDFEIIAIALFFLFRFILGGKKKKNNTVPGEIMINGGTRSKFASNESDKNAFDPYENRKGYNGKGSRK